MTKSVKNTGILLVAISAVSYGFMPVFVKIAYAAGVSTYTLLFLRFLVATTFMFSLILIRQLSLPSQRDRIAFLLIGAFVYVGQSFFFFTALNHASASLVTLILHTYPALVMVGSVLFLHESITRAKVIALGLALLGAFIIIGTEFDASPYGIFMAALTAIFYAAYMLISAKFVKEGMGIQASAFIMLGATLVFGLANLYEGFTPPTDQTGYLAILLIAMISTVLAFWSFLTGLEKTGASTAALIAILEPVVTVLSAVIILSEDLTPNIVLGGLLVLTALLITTLSTKESGG